MKIKDTPKINRSENITRQCAICGGDISVKIFPGGKYTGGNYFSTIDQTEKRSQTIKMEYWECNKCFNSWEE